LRLRLRCGRNVERARRGSKSALLLADLGHFKVVKCTAGSRLGDDGSRMSLSIGVVLIDGRERAAYLLRRAHAHRYAAKIAGGDRVSGGR
jgi:GGDEF domain-containing protein